VITRDLRVPTKQEPPEPGDLRGSLLSVPFKLVRLIGSGGMGQVWEAASDDLPGWRLAVKVVAAEPGRDPSTVARFFGEARAASAIDDPNIVKVYGTGRTEDNRPALVMPYIEGQSLADLCDERGRLPLDVTGKILLQLASALRAAHGADIVHRDIKPQNVMLMARRWGVEYFVILVDFGICKFHDKAMAGNIHSITNQYIGTPGYSAPEQLHGRPVSAKADIYALGVLAYRILCGRLPFVGDSNMAVMTQQCDPHATFPEPHVHRPDMPREWNDLVTLCLERDPARRPSASEFGRWIAAGMKNGASMLTSLAPQIAAETRSSANAATISSDVPTALAQIQALTRLRASRRSRVASLGAAALAGVIATTVVFTLAGSSQEPSVPTRTQPTLDPSSSTSAQAQTSPLGDANQERSAPSTAPANDMASTVGATPAPARAPAGPQAASPIEMTPDTGPNGSHGAANPATRSSPEVAISGIKSRLTTRTTASAQPSSETASDGPARTSRAANGTNAAESARSRRATGTLEIRAKTWADCFLVDGGSEISIGTAPITVKDLSVGRHRVRCKNDGQSKDETDTVTIDAAKIAVIEKNW
jgi:eukaryotic-like serine/threonine-protein kinase